jgi:DNA-binding FrmR family transcriptional regulator
MGTVEQIARAIAELFGFAKPLLDEHLAQRYRNELAAGQRGWRDALESRRPERIHRAVRELLDAIGQPVADLDDQPATINVPVEYLDELVQCGFRLRCLDQQLSAVQRAVNQAKS